MHPDRNPLSAFMSSAYSTNLRPIVCVEHRNDSKNSIYSFVTDVYWIFEKQIKINWNISQISSGKIIWPTNN